MVVYLEGVINLACYVPPCSSQAINQFTLPPPPPTLLSFPSLTKIINTVENIDLNDYFRNSKICKYNLIYYQQIIEQFHLNPFTTELSGKCIFLKFSLKNGYKRERTANK